MDDRRILSAVEAQAVVEQFHAHECLLDRLEKCLAEAQKLPSGNVAAKRARAVLMLLGLTDYLEDLLTFPPEQIEPIREVAAALTDLNRGVSPALLEFEGSPSSPKFGVLDSVRFGCAVAVMKKLMGDLGKDEAAHMASRMLKCRGFEIKKKTLITFHDTMTSKRATAKHNAARESCDFFLKLAEQHSPREGAELIAYLIQPGTEKLEQPG